VNGASFAPAALVLNVNDRDSVRYMITRMLQRGGFEVIEAASGHQALQQVRERRPRLVVLDIKLPDIDGLDVCRRIKQDADSPPIKVLHTSAVFVSPEAKVQSLNSGADGYLSHPFEQEELIAVARSLLRLLDAEQRLRDTARELYQANQRIHEFLAMLAHELRNPLAAIVSCLPLIEREAARSDAERSARHVMRRQSAHLRRLVDDLLDAARVTQGKIEPKWETTDLAALLTRVADNCRRTLTDGRQQTLTSRIPAGPVLMRADPLRLEQVFSNLLDNASKYADRGGQVELALEVRQDRAHVMVRDDGMGIAPESLATIFNLFSQGEVSLARSRGGLGIGLTLAQSLVQMHGGTVSASSDGLGKGCTMDVTLPLTMTLGAPPPSPVNAESVIRSSALRILVVEDNDDAQLMMKYLLEAWGHEVLVASDGSAGLHAIRTHRPDVALVDIGLPIVSGYEIARLINADDYRSQMMLIALTGYGAPEQRQRALDAGFDLHLVKPVEPALLAGVISAGRPGAALS